MGVVIIQGETYKVTVTELCRIKVITVDVGAMQAASMLQLQCKKILLSQTT